MRNSIIWKRSLDIRLGRIEYYFRTAAKVSDKNKARHRDWGKSVDAFAELEMNERVGRPRKIGRRVLGNLEQMRQNWMDVAKVRDKVARRKRTGRARKGGKCDGSKIKNEERERGRGQMSRRRERERKTRKDHGGIHGWWDETGWDEMIVLHVARARTDSINIRGSLGKTRAALWITSVTFLYFSGCDAHPFHSLFLPTSLLLSFPSHYFPFTIFSYPPVIVVRSLSLLYPHAMLPSRSHTPLSFPPLSFSISFLTRLHLRFPLLEQMETRHSRTVSLFRIVILSAEMETIPAPVLAKLSCRIIRWFVP